MITAIICRKYLQGQIFNNSFNYKKILILELLLILALVNISTLVFEYSGDHNELSIWMMLLSATSLAIIITPLSSILVLLSYPVIYFGIILLSFFIIQKTNSYKMRFFTCVLVDGFIGVWAIILALKFASGV
jgi:hypothetical protein